MKKHTGKTLLSLVLALLMLATSVPFAFADSDLDIGGRCGRNLFWKLDDQGTLTIFGSGEMQFYYQSGDWDDDDYEYEEYDSWYDYHDEIRTVVIESGATSIATYAFEDCYNLTSVSIPNTVTKIGNRAFDDCDDLDTITIPNSVTSIGSYAFAYCDSLTQITIPAGVTVIENGTFNNCDSLEHVYLPNGITAIGDYAFYYCNSLQEAPIPSGVKTIGEGAFRYCYNLTSISIPASVESIGDGAFANGRLQTITVDSNNPYYISANNALFDSPKTQLLQYATGNAATSYTVPTQTKTIGGYAFYSADNLQSVDLQNVETINERAFYDSDALKTVTMNRVVTICSEAFEDCYTLETVSVSGALQKIGDEAFCWCESLTEAPITENVTTIGYEAFAWCESLSTVTIPAKVEEIGGQAFYCCNGLQSISVASANPYFASDASGVLYNKDKTLLIQYPIGNPRTSFTVASPVETVGSYAFCQADNLASVTMQSTVQKLEYDAFGDCDALISVSLPGSLETIGSYAFQSCSRLPAVTIPAGVTRIESRAFSACESLTTFTVNAANKNYTAIDGVLFTKGGATLVQYPLGNVRTAYAVPDGTRRIGAYAFTDADILQQVTLPETIIVIGREAFRDADGLQSIKLPPFLKEIPYEAFEYCDSLRTVYIPYSTTTIGWDAFDCELSDVYYAGSQEEWDEIDISGNYGLDEAVIHFCDHPATRRVSAVAASCSKPGYTAGLQCTSCERWLKGHKPIYVSHTDSDGDGICDACSRLTTEISVGETKTISLFEGETKRIRFVPLEDGYYNFSYRSNDDDAWIEWELYDDNMDWTDGWLLAGETYYYELYNWDYYDNTTVQVDLTLTKNSAGFCGNHLAWNVSDYYDEYYDDENDYDSTEKTLILGGYGKMWDYSEDPAPWADIDGISRVQIGDEVGTLSIEAFSSIRNLKAVINLSYETVLASQFLPLHKTVVMYCYNGSAEHQYCMKNGVPYTLLDEETEFMRDEDTDVSVAYLPEAFDDSDVSLNVKEKETGNANSRSWDIKPVDEDGNTVQPNIPVQIWLPLPENWNGKYLLVTHKHEDGTVEYITNYSINGDYVVFWVSAFSIFTVEAQDEHEHKFDETVEAKIITPATCEKEGVGIRTCIVCGEDVEVTIPALGHTDANNDGKCDMCGKQMDGPENCPQCGKIHNGGFFDKLTGFFHKIIYRLTHLFNR